MSRPGCLFGLVQYSWVIFVYLFFPALPGYAATTIGDARSAYRKNQIAEAKVAFAALAADPATSSENRAAARRELARIAWLLDGDTASAESQLQAPDAWLNKPCETAALLVRVEREAGQPKLAVEAATQHNTQCDVDRDPFLIQEARAWIDVAVERTGQARLDALSKAKANVNALTAESQRSLDASRLTLELGLFSNSPEMALAGWKSFFWLVKEEAPPALAEDFPGARQVFRDALHSNASTRCELELLRMLVRAGFGQEAEKFASVRGLASHAQKNLEWSSIAAYFRFRSAVESITLAHYRSLAHGKDESVVYKTETTKLIDTTADDLSPHVGANGPTSRETLRKQWGLYWTLGLTGGYMSLHLGHIVEETHENIAQHGRTGTVERIVLENMISNGYESWLWDGWAQAGGWAEAGARVIQVRTSYVGSVLNAAAQRHGHPARERAEAELPALEHQDLNVLQSNTLADLPGLARRLYLQTIDQMVADMKSVGQSPDDAITFQERYWNAWVQATITIHEGRHVLDQRQYSGAQALASDELEFRAKLSELEFGEYPRLSLAAMVTGQIGGNSAHGKSNTRLLVELRRWIEANEGSVAGYTAERPTLSQVDKLTDQQLRDFACSADPACKIR